MPAHVAIVVAVASALDLAQPAEFSLSETPAQTSEDNTVGLLKQMKDMRATLAEAPAMVAQAQELAAAAQANAQAAQSYAYPTAAGYGSAVGSGAGAGIGLDDPRLVPIAGVDITLYARLSKVAATERLDEAGLRLRAVAYGVTATAWDEATAGWQARMKGDTALAVHFGAIYTQVSI